MPDQQSDPSQPTLTAVNYIPDFLDEGAYKLQSVAEDPTYSTLNRIGAGLGSKLASAASTAYQSSPALNPLGMVEGAAKSAYNAASLFGDVATGQTPMQVMNPETGEITLNPEVINRSTNLAGTLMGGGVVSEGPEALANGVNPNQTNIFAGIGARTADRAALEHANTLENLGADKTEIWDKTGWFRGTDGQWRFEIPDNQAQVHPDLANYVANTGKLYQNNLPTVFQHPELYEAYPQLAENKAYLYNDPSKKAYSGMYDPNDASVNLNVYNRPLSDINSTGIHELQHAVQDLEGFAPGSNPTMFKDIQDLDPNLAYHRTSGEVEARNAEERMNWPLENRQALPPWFSEDVPSEHQLIIHPDTGQPAQITPVDHNPFSDDQNTFYSGGNKELAPALLAELAHNPNNLPMDLESRMQRAKDMGFDPNIVYYHGTMGHRIDFDPETNSFRDPMDKRGDNAVYLTKNPGIADYYTGHLGSSTVGGHTFPLLAKIQNPKIIDWSQKDYPRLFLMSDKMKEIAKARAEGHDAVVFKNVYDPGPKSMAEKPSYTLSKQQQTAVFDPKNLRSVNAVFDPEFSQSNNILYSGGNKKLAPLLFAPKTDQYGWSPQASKYLNDEFAKSYPEEGPNDYVKAGKILGIKNGGPQTYQNYLAFNNDATPVPYAQKALELHNNEMHPTLDKDWNEKARGILKDAQQIASPSQEAILHDMLMDGPKSLHDYVNLEKGTDQHILKYGQQAWDAQHGGENQWSPKALDYLTKTAKFYPGAQKVLESGPGNPVESYPLTYQKAMDLHNGETTPWSKGAVQYLKNMQLSFGEGTYGANLAKSLLETGPKTVNHTGSGMFYDALNIHNQEMGITPSTGGTHPPAPGTYENLYNEPKNNYDDYKQRRIEKNTKFVGPTIPHNPNNLDLSEAARMERAKQLGFNTEQTFYHGSGKPLDASNRFEPGNASFRDPRIKGEPGIFLASDPEIANAYTEGGTGEVSPLLARTKNPKVSDWGGYGYSSERMHKEINQAISEGHDSLHIKNISDVGSEEPQDQYVIFDPNNLRSKFAVFDPKFSSSSNLLSAGGVPFVRITPVQQNPFEEDKK